MDVSPQALQDEIASQSGGVVSSGRQHTVVLLIIIALSVLVILIGAVSIYLWIWIVSHQQPTKSMVAQSRAIITGKITFEGYIPGGSYISIAERETTHEQFREVVTGLTPASGIVYWNWTDADKGRNYEIKALLKNQGKILQESSLVTISAPASNINLILVSGQTPPQVNTVTLSGLVNLDGYAPPGSYLQVLAKTIEDSSFRVVANTIPAIDNVNWGWNTALSGTTYILKAQLVSSAGAILSTDGTQTTTAPSTGLLLNAISSASPSAPLSTGISGTITINGVIPTNAMVTLGIKPSGQQSFTEVISNLSATSGVGFSWPNAQSGSTYDMQAYLWKDGKPYAQSDIQTVTAPSTFNVLTINAQEVLAPPSGSSISVSCGSSQNNLYQATMKFNTQANLLNAASYTVIATLVSQNNQVVNTTISPSNPATPQSFTTTYVFQPGVTYFAQYAYATRIGGVWSPLSPAVQFACP